VLNGQRITLRMKSGAGLVLTRAQMEALSLSMKEAAQGTRAMNQAMRTLAQAAAPSRAQLRALMNGSFPGKSPVRELELAFDVEPIVGWRMFLLHSFQRRGGVAELRLASLTGRENWPPRERMTATCSVGRGYGEPPPAHEAPWPGCGCGLWTTRERAAALHEGKEAGGSVLAEVAQWGRVLEFERGWRAQYAYPLRLIVHNPASADRDRRRAGGPPTAELVAELERVYGVPVRTEMLFLPERIHHHDEELARQLLEARQSQPAAAGLALSLGFQDPAEIIAELLSDPL
jgi:hypothetical protein